MVKSTSKIITCGLASLLMTLPVLAAEPTDVQRSEIDVTLEDMLTVTVSKSAVSDTGGTNLISDTFLKDYTRLHVQTNNASGFSATMTTKTTETRLLNKSSASATPIQTLSEAVKSEASFPVGKWGFSLNGSDATEAVYHPLVAFGSATPSVVAKTTTNADSYTDIYFGTKGNSSTASGTYANAVIISVTAPPSPSSEDPENPPVTPVDPVTPVNPTNDEPSAPSRAPSRAIADTTDTEEPSASDAHEEPQGVVEDTTTEEVHLAGSNLGMSLAAGATVTAAAGLIFFILAKRKEDEEEEDTK